MALTQRLEFRQSQSLVMTPQLMQAIKLLQLSNLDLSAFVEEELERNPLLERASDGPSRRSRANRPPSGANIPAMRKPGCQLTATRAPASVPKWPAGASGDGFEPPRKTG